MLALPQALTVPRALEFITWATAQQIEAWASLFYGPKYSLLSIRSDRAGWVLDQEAIELQRIASTLGIDVRINRGISPYAAQCCHYTSQFVLHRPRYFRTRNRVSLDYYHGLPDTAPEFKLLYEGLRRHHAAIERVRVSHSQMEQVVLESGIDPGKVRRIPIGINMAYFQLQTAESRREARRCLGLPESAAIIGSFQKDGVGWGEGNDPKRVKGPDVFLHVIEQLKPRVPELYVLLSGPARGFVRKGLEQQGVPYRHVYVNQYEQIGGLFQALDLYLITSREEGGPKAVLESMASGVPLVTTRVGQAMDLVQHGQNGWMTEVKDTEGLAHGAEYVLHHRLSPEIEETLKNGRKTAEANSYVSQMPLWRAYMEGFVESYNGTP
jgi:glycosyltransferase involved in cell wall biosynthesis